MMNIRQMMVRGPLALLAALGLIAGAASSDAQPNLAQPRVGIEASEVVKEVTIDAQLGAQVPLHLEFTDDGGKQIRLSDYVKEKPVLLVLAYYRCPMLCSEVLNGVVRGLKPLELEPGKDFDVVVVSIDPKETPKVAAEKKAGYVEYYGRPESASGWHFLTGQQESIDLLAGTVGFRYVYDVKSNQYAHAGGIMLLTPKGKISHYFYGVEYAPKDVKLGLVEASSGTIGSVADKVILLCYQYDPVTGKYGLVIKRALQIGAILTIGTFGTFLVVMRRRDRRQKATMDVQGTA